jgi:hypothetical protein
MESDAASGSKVLKIYFFFAHERYLNIGRLGKGQRLDHTSPRKPARYDNLTLSKRKELCKFDEELDGTLALTSDV